MNFRISQNAWAKPERRNRSMLLRSVSVLLLTLAMVVNVHADEKATARTLVTFSAMGDVPYLPTEYLLLPKQIAELPNESEFVVHLGDIKTGKMPCIELTYETVAGILAKSKLPLFIIPGDNEWNDCANPDEGWSLWLKHFSRFEEKWKHNFNVERQAKRDENFAFVRSEVLFIGINLVGGRVHNEAEWKKRHAEDLEWTRKYLDQYAGKIRSAVIFGHAYPVKVHDDYFDGLNEAALKFNKPMLYLHGDGHKWIHDHPFKAQNILRVQVDQGGIAPPITVTVTDDSKDPFVIDRRKDNEKTQN